MKKNRLTIVIIGIILFAIGFGVWIYNSTNADHNESREEKVYTMQEALSTEFYTANFNVEAKSLVISTQRLEGDKFTKITELSISKEDEQILINEIEQLKLTKGNFESYKAFNADSYYSLYLTISTGYRLLLDSKEKTLYISEEETSYIIKNGDKFFALLEKIKKKHLQTIN
ncbi:hypothetical protein MKZ17_11835 [Solibacillus sp. FSL R7-0682]|uniref:hypothetical protein n=1 Tax=Solibacillus sp. FSL R7-0682 TaxID=2921690 RepID=UPI0030F54E2B